jgi:PAS domain-containing protein
MVLRGNMSQVEGPGGLTELRRQAETILRERTSQSAFSSGASFPAADALRALHELSVHQIELEAQNEELQRAIAEVEAGRERYSNFYDLSPVGFCSLSDQGVFLEANHTMARMLGIPQDELVGQSFARYIITWIREARPRRLDPFLVNSREVASPISRGDAREP